MTLKNVFFGLLAGLAASIVAILVIIILGIDTDAVVFGADKFTIWMMIFVIGIVTGIATEVVSESSAKEVLLDAIVAAIVASAVIRRDLSWLSYNEPIQTGIHMFQQNLWVAVVSSLSSPAVKMGDKMMSHKFGKE